MLVDEVEVKIKAGHGGPGHVHFAPKMSGPDGGSGGKGGDIYAVGVGDIGVLRRYLREKKIEAEDGKRGGRNQKTGADGQDFLMPVPVSSTITDLKTSEKFTVDKVGQKVLIAAGGKGGKGNYELRSATNTTPRLAQPGLAGQERQIRIVLRLIADIGLIGLPNAGKSSLLNELTNSSAKTASYPFTTLEPNLGDFFGLIIADIPGLIEGASAGKGLGTRFLKHIEKVPNLVHCISCESNNPAKDFKTIVAELREFNPKLVGKQKLILLTKTDLLDKNKVEKKKKALKQFGLPILPVSIHNWNQLEALKKRFLKFNKKKK